MAEERSLADDPLFADLTPVPEHPAGNLVVNIRVSKLFQEASEYFRALLVKGEYSERGLKLAAFVIAHNSANYTAWHYRRKCLELIDGDFNAELAYVSKISQSQAKNYQVWQHRKLVVEKLNNAGNEFKDTKLNLEIDAKNYHVWSYRQWLLRTFPFKLDEEFAFADSLLQDDIRNNSAWNHRYFLLQTFEKFVPASVEREVNYAVQSLVQLKYNESAWNYLEGLTRLPSFTQFPLVLKLASSVTAVESRCRFAHAFLLEVLANASTPTDLPAELFDAAMEFTVAGIEESAKEAMKKAKVSGADADASLSASELNTLPAAGTTSESSSSTSSSASEATETKSSSTKSAAAVKCGRAANVDRAKQACEVLIIIDGVRAKFWTYRLAQLDVLAQQLAAPPT